MYAWDILELFTSGLIGCIRDILSYFDRSALQVIFIGVGIFEQLIQITQQGADVVDIKGGMLQAVSSIKVLGAILRGSGKCKVSCTLTATYSTFTDDSRC